MGRGVCCMLSILMGGVDVVDVMNVVGAESSYRRMFGLFRGRGGGRG